MALALGAQLASAAVPRSPRRPADPRRELASAGRLLDRLVRAAIPPEPWTRPAFAREVERVRLHLGPIRSRTTLAASFGRESHRVEGRHAGEPGAGTPGAGAPGLTPGARARALGPGVRRALAASPIEVAYAVRWLELGDGVRRPSWLELATAGPGTSSGRTPSGRTQPLRP